jgi:hypothetical protein
MFLTTAFPYIRRLLGNRNLFHPEVLMQGKKRTGRLLRSWFDMDDVTAERLRILPVGRLLPLAFLFVLLLTSAAKAIQPEVIVDNADAAGVTITGTWLTGSGTQSYGTNNLNDNNAGKGSKSVTFTPNITVSGVYQVYAWWVDGATRATNTLIDVVSADGTVTKTVNQQVNGGQWRLMGTFRFNTGTGGYVKVRNNGTNGVVSADAVRFVKYNPEIISDDADTAGVTTIGSWNSNTGGYAGAHLADGNTNKGGKSVTFAPALPDTGNYEVYLQWPAISDNATNVPVDIRHAWGVYDSWEADETTSDGQWVFAGSYWFNSGSSGYVLLSNSFTSSRVVADATKFVKLGNETIVEVGDPTGVSMVGTWTTASTSTTFIGSSWVNDGNPATKGNKSITFTPNLPNAGRYGIYLWWEDDTTYSNQVPVDVITASGTTTITVNQRKNGGKWVSLGNYQLGSGTATSVRIRNAVPAGSGAVTANAVDFVQEVDTDNDGIPDMWENHYGLNPAVNDANQDADGDGLTNLQEFQNGTDPTDYFNGISHSLVIASGTNQVGYPSTFAAQPLAVRFWNETLVNAPVTFSIFSGAGKLAPSANPALLTTSYTAVTGNDGVAQAYFYFPPAYSATNSIQVMANPNRPTYQYFTASTFDNHISFVPDGPLTQVTGTSVQVTCASPGNFTIHYTTNGFDPTDADPVVVSGSSVRLDTSAILKASAWSTGHLTGPVKTASYNFTGAVTGGAQHSLAIRSDGTVWAWGANESGQLGVGTTTMHTSPVQVPGIVNAISIAADGNISTALTGDGKVYQWGGGTLTPQQTTTVPGATGIVTGSAGTLVSTGTVTYAVGTNHQLKMSANGALQGRYDNSLYQIGWYVTQLQPNGQWLSAPYPGFTSDWVDSTDLSGDPGRLTARGDHDFCISNGNVWWLGTIGSQSTPAWTSGIYASRNATAIASGIGHGILLTSTGSVLTWGVNARGETGQGSIDGGSVWYRTGAASTVPPLNGFVAIGAGEYHSLAVSSYGEVWTWGDNGGGQLGDGSTFSQGSPVRTGFYLDKWDDTDNDGLIRGKELELGSNPYAADTNSDGISDGKALAWGLSLTDTDMDGDGVSNAQEIAQGSNPFLQDSDGDGVPDNSDAFPLDPTRSSPLTPVPGDTTPPTITLTKPAGAILTP